MKAQKSWISAGLLAAIFSALVAHAAAKDAGAEAGSKLEQHASMPKLDASIFSKDAASSGEKHQFGAEVPRLLSILAHNIYDKDKLEVVTRELLSNSVDALEKQRARSLSKMAQTTEGGQPADDTTDYKVVVEMDPENGIISFTDNGIGMTRDELKSFLGTIARSGTAADKESGDAQMIGQFGVGFYSVLQVADQVAVISKSDQDSKQWIWETDTTASFRITEDPAGPTLGRGTRVMLKVKEAEKASLMNFDNMEKIMKKSFGYDHHPIYLIKPKTLTEEVPIEEEEGEKDKAASETSSGDKKEGEEPEVKVEEEEEEDKEAKPKTKKVEKTIMETVLISQNVKPIWKRSPSEVKPEEYEALYKTVSGDKYGKPIAYTHFCSATAKSESFCAVVFIPERPPFQPFSQNENRKANVKLHVRRVFVADLEDFLPKNLGFVTVIIDSEDLSLNISRESVKHGELRGIKKKVIRKIIDRLLEMATSSDKDKFKKFYNAYSSFIKLEIAENDDYRSMLAKLLRYKTTKGEMRSLEEYIAEMPEGQKTKKALYYLAGPSDEIEKSPFLGRFKAKGREVILGTASIDEHAIQQMKEFDGYQFVNIAKEGIKLDDEDEQAAKEFDEKYKTAKSWVAKALKDVFEKVVFVPGPAEVPGSIKSSEFGWTGNMERLIKAQSSVEEDPMFAFFSRQKKILELNPQHALIQEILERANTEGKADKELKSTLRTLTDAMMIWSGYTVRDNALFARGIERMTRKSLGMTTEPLKSEAEEGGDAKKKVGEAASDSDDLDIPSFDFEAEAAKEKGDSGKSTTEQKKQEEGGEAAEASKNTKEKEEL